MNVVGHYLHVAPLPKPAMTDGGIVLLEHYNDDRKQYRVLGAGPKVNPEIVPGCCVLANLYSDTKYQFEDGSLIIHDSQCVAVWTPNP